MLIRFSVKNYLSFKESTEFSMAASKIVRHHDHVETCLGKRILKGGYVFGPNASGKSNLVKAMDFAKNIIVRGIENTNLDHKWFRIDERCQYEPGIFQFDIFSHDHFYSYGFALSYATGLLEEEWLYEFDDPSKERCIFLRQKSDDGSYEISSDLRFSDEKEASRFSFYKDDFSSSKLGKTLFLSDMVRRSPEEVKEYQPFSHVAEWFDRLIIIFPDSKFQGIARLLESESEQTRLENLLAYFDTGITSIRKKEVDLDKVFASWPTESLEELKNEVSRTLGASGSKALLRNKGSLIEISNDSRGLTAYEIFSSHSRDDDLFEYADESDGTKRLFDLIPVFEEALKGAVIVIDELDKSLHTLAVSAFIEYFYALCEGVPSQLIVTTHDSNVLDLDFLRQDEIWFLERKSDHSSHLYSLNKYKTRFDKRIEKDYLLGRYGAVPHLHKL